MWRNFLSSVQFLTILPLGPALSFDARGAVPFFPICGLIVGALLAWIDIAAALLWERPVAAVIDVLTLVTISGALHLDGLADTADGLYGHRPPERVLAIMKDSRIGAIGMVAVTCCLGIKWAALSSLSADRFHCLLLVPAFARASVLFGIRSLPYGRPEGGTGHAFFKEPLHPIDFWGVAVISALSLLFMGWRAVLIGAGFALLIISVLFYYRRKINCITGDMLGAMIEISEAGLFLLLSATFR